ncbi:hypothetical protein LX97_00234 [Nonlabens dokdonensis]|jgi:hypothetical protein|uniref:Uncharacterized protein n=2 Tax=Nonlabens dokdonensis TaxID=328515 RepID=L7W212_NONDD|nr:hypothetical protein [Nonlabens dokdonensis]AGC75540.1 hypothetical protein DDD_0413 [Nonlabens dokdonensis DSW-6]PZX43234.1 hypothetical protein LX97_00234 [Nonlabens dokdonensis]
MEVFFKILIVVANLAFVFYLLYVIRGLIKNGKNVFEHRNKTASIIILILTLVHLGKKESEAANSFEIVYTKDNSAFFDTNLYEIENIVFDHVNLFVKSKEIDENSDLVEVVLSQSGLVMGTEFKLIKSEMQCLENNCFLRTNYLKTWNIYGIQLYSQLKTKKTPLN